VVVRDKLADRDLGGGRGPGGGGGRPGGGAGRQEDAELAAMRRRLREHPCHHCPDREQHVRQAEHYRRQQRETEGLERRVAGRTHVIARTFERVCAVLDRLGYLRADAVTAEGRRLGSLYTELDLLAAECLRRGLWDGLTVPELAACVSALSFESRRPDDTSPPKLPPGRVREVFGSMVRVWGELDQMERDNGLSFLREPDPGFAWTAYQWARGRALQDVLDDAPDVAAGDFVRWTKQVVDLLDQVAAAAAGRGSGKESSAGRGSGKESSAGRGSGKEGSAGRGSGKEGAAGLGGVAATARSAAEAMRRGVIAYTSVG
jgi:ATP-dependent RNA helicase HelY